MEWRDDRDLGLPPLVLLDDGDISLDIVLVGIASTMAPAGVGWWVPVATGRMGLVSSEIGGSLGFGCML